MASGRKRVTRGENGAARAENGPREAKNRPETGNGTRKRATPGPKTRVKTTKSV